MYDNTGRSMDSHAHSVGNRVIYFDEFDRHTAHFYGLFRLNNIELYLSVKSLLFEFSLNETYSKLCSINRNIDFLEKVSETAYMITRVRELSQHRVSYLCCAQHK